MVPVPETVFIPFPAKATMCGLPEAPSVMESVEERGPVEAGEKVKVKVQNAPASTVDPQSLLCANSVPTITTDEMERDEFPVFVSVTLDGREVVVPAIWLKN